MKLAALKQQQHLDRVGGLEGPNKAVNIRSSVHLGVEQRRQCSAQGHEREYQVTPLFDAAQANHQMQNGNDAADAADDDVAAGEERSHGAVVTVDAYDFLSSSPFFSSSCMTDSTTWPMAFPVVSGLTSLESAAQTNDSLLMLYRRVSRVNCTFSP